LIVSKSKQNEPKKSHPAQIVLPPWLIIHRIAVQCGVGAMSGDIKKPCRSYGVHSLG